MVDAVITWVDGDDPKHIKKKNRYINNPNIPDKYKVSTRWASKFELYYSVRLLRKNAPWLDNIYLITDDQKPDWLDTETQRVLNVTIVSHREIFTGFEEYLPTFNSCAIEAMMHRINDLKESFIYLNDDFFVIKKIQKEDYFKNGKLIWRGKFDDRRFTTRIKKRIGIEDKIGYVGFKKGQSKTKNSFKLAHAPYPCNKRELRKLMEGNNLIQGNVKYRFKNQENVFPHALLANVGFEKRFSKRGPKDWGYIHPELHGSKQIIDLLQNYKNKKKIKTVCIQSIDQMDKSTQKIIKTFLDELLKD